MFNLQAPGLFDVKQCATLFQQSGHLCSAKGLLSQDICLAQMKSAGNPVVLANSGKEVLAFRGKQRYLTQGISVPHTHNC